MIVKQVGCNSVRAGILYAGNKKDAEIIISNNCFGNPNEVANQFQEVQQNNKTTNDKNKTYHVVIGFSQKDIEKLDEHNKEQIVKDFANDLGFENNQYIAYQHYDGNSPHFHFIGNRIDENGKSVSLSNNYYKHESFCRNQELKYDLEQVKTKERGASINQFQTLKNHRKIELKEVIDLTIKECKNIDEFKDRMKVKGIDVKIGRGISYIDKDKAKFKGSSIGREYSLSKTEERIYRDKQINNELKY